MSILLSYLEPDHSQITMSIFSLVLYPFSNCLFLSDEFVGIPVYGLFLLWTDFGTSLGLPEIRLLSHDWLFFAVVYDCLTLSVFLVLAQGDNMILLPWISEFWYSSINQAFGLTLSCENPLSLILENDWSCLFDLMKFFFCILSYFLLLVQASAYFLALALALLSLFLNTV